MRLMIDTDRKTLVIEDGAERLEVGLYSPEAFRWLSMQWLKVGWDQKYTYSFSWLGRPIIQLPEDMVRAQEVIYRLRPDVIVETGVAHGGSLIFYASLCKAIGKGRVIGVDIEIRPHNRAAIESHALFSYVDLVEGNSTDPAIVQQVRSMIKEHETAVIFLDSNHTKEHVLAELEAYHGLVPPGSYIVATDGIMKDLYDVPRGNSEWVCDHPASAALEFVQSHPEFVIEQPRWLFNESPLKENVTYWPGGWLKRVR
jgi:cephalosporin hydroxylase